ncbi:MAG: response regulator, partial [Acidobacteria bacterium]|nr:response regulator [Acidobacteriota bacterium]
MRVLIADDDRVAATMLQRAAEGLGLDPVVAHDGGQAWQILQQDPAVALAILDWMMPGADGLELCRRIRQDAARSHMYLMLLTARDGRADLV